MTPMVEEEYNRIKEMTDDEIVQIHIRHSNSPYPSMVCLSAINHVMNERDLEYDINMQYSIRR